MSGHPEEPLVSPSAYGPRAYGTPAAGAPATVGPPPLHGAHPPPTGYASYGYPGPDWGAPQLRSPQDPAEALRKARTALGWAIGAAVGAFLAMAIAVVALVSDAGAALDDYAYEPLRGEVVGLPDGSTLSGDRLERPIVDLLREYGVGDADISCPDTASVTVSTAVVCSGDVDGFAWTGIVFFEDSEGTFVVVEV